MSKFNFTAEEVKAMIDKNWDTVLKYYTHIPKLTVEEIEDFLNGKPGKEIERGYNRSHQFRQVISGIGGLVDDGTADAETYKIYKALWKIEEKAKCQYCGKTYTYSLMFGTNGVCSRAKCQLNHMRDNI